MVRHIVVFRLKEGTAKDDPRVGRAFEALRSLEGKIMEIRQWQVGENITERPVAADFALDSTFETRDDLARYVDHPAHREVVELLKEVCSWQVCDYET